MCFLTFITYHRSRQVSPSSVLVSLGFLMVFILLSMTPGIGSAISVALCKYFLDGIYIWLRNRNKNDGKPEYRLPLVIIGGVTLPLTLISYGWIAQTAAPMPLILITTALLGATLLLTYVPLTTYVVDATGEYAASAMTAVIVSRCLMGTFLPLAVQPIVDRCGWGLGMTSIAAVSLCLVPIPVFIYLHGETWRQKSRYTRDEKISATAASSAGFAP